MYKAIVRNTETNEQGIWTFYNPVYVGDKKEVIYNHKTITIVIEIVLF